ncbi:MAG: hypothetical protein IH861_03110 [Chloroflexi bacterium]|nr:hypothetical protein [Chloroflexota bacterium]
MSNAKDESFRGQLVLPGEQESRSVRINVEPDTSGLTVKFDAPVEGDTDWAGSNVRIARRLKYSEVVFTTIGLPKETVELTWKINASLLDDSIAGVIIPKPNDQKVTGERGFVLRRE